jgi:hypothetical protein
MNKEIHNLIDEYMDKSANPEVGDNFEDAMFLEQDICTKFGIKHHPQVSNFFAKLNETKDKDAFISSMKAYASSYLSSPPETPQSLLEKAVANKLDAQEVLPELDIRTHIYPLFVYNEILLQGKDDVEKVLEEFNLIKELSDGDLLNDIGLITFSKIDPQVHPLYEKVMNSGLSYIGDFFKSQMEMYRSYL